MAANPVVVVDHGRVEIPEELQSDPRFRDGARLQLVPVPVEMSEEERRLAWDSFLSLRGLFADSDFDPNAELEREKQQELAAEDEWLRK